jgi:hypothetical protein
MQVRHNVIMYSYTKFTKRVQQLCKDLDNSWSLVFLKSYFGWWFQNKHFTKSLYWVIKKLKLIYIFILRIKGSYNLGKNIWKLWLVKKNTFIRLNERDMILFPFNDKTKKSDLYNIYSNLKKYNKFKFYSMFKISSIYDFIKVYIKYILQVCYFFKLYFSWILFFLNKSNIF